jgi:hypothetical protein
MSPRSWYLIGMLVLLFLANVAMLIGLTNWPQRSREGFAAAIVSGAKKLGAASGSKPVEKFEDFLQSAGGSAFATAPIGSYDGINMAAGFPPEAQGFRRNHPNEPLAGPAVEVGPDNLFIFKNNQCKPECCGATLSCDGGCVCTTVEQKNFLNQRGGNRKHDDGF